jgi:hypothetical protein
MLKKAATQFSVKDLHDKLSSRLEKNVAEIDGLM